MESITLEYATTNNVLQSNGVYIRQYTFDDDIAVIPEELVAEGLNWRIRRAKGLAYEEEFNDYEVNRYQVLKRMLLWPMPVAYSVRSRTLMYRMATFQSGDTDLKW